MVIFKTGEAILISEYTFYGRFADKSINVDFSKITPADSVAVGTRCASFKKFVLKENIFAPITVSAVYLDKICCKLLCFQECYSCSLLTIRER